MKNSTIQSNVCQGENENVGQASHISQSSGYWFPIYEGIFEHCQRMSDAVWFFMWLIARTLEEPDGRGAVLGGISISDERPAGELGVKAKTISRWRRILVTGGYILAVRTSHGYTYTLLKSKKWQIRKKSDLPKQAITKGVISQNGRSDRPNREIRYPKSGDHSVSILNDNTADNTEEEAAEEKPAAPPAREKPKTNRYPQAWKAIDIKPRGSWKFALAWEKFYRDRPEYELLSDTMERCIQYCNENGIKPPPPFFEAKRRVERDEAQQSFPKAEVHPI